MSMKQANARSLSSDCASDADWLCRQRRSHIYPLGLFGQRVVGNSLYVTISNVWNEMDGLPLAEKHCAQYGKSARFNHMEATRAIFDCIKSS